MPKLEQLFSDIQATAAQPLESARALPAGAYADAAFFDWERDAVLAKQWQSVAHVSQLREPGAYLNLELLGEAITVVHTEAGSIQALSRVCPHRGMDIMPPESGHARCGSAKQFRCPYHHWVYGLDGRLKGAPFMKDHFEVTGGELRLREIRTEVWEGFVFVCLDDSEVVPLAESLAGLRPFLERWRMAELHMVADIEWDCPFNWKVLVENFMEPYHHAGAHHAIFQPTLPAQHCWAEPEARHYGVCHLPLATDLQALVKAGQPQLLSFTPMPDLLPTDYLEWTVYVAYPHFLLFVAADRVYWYRMQAQGPDRLLLTTTMLVTEAARQAPGFERTLASEVDLMQRFHLEDMEVCGAVQKGLQSRFYQPGPLASLEAPIWQFQRYLARCIAARGAREKRDLAVG